MPPERVTEKYNFKDCNISLGFGQDDNERGDVKWKSKILQQ